MAPLKLDNDANERVVRGLTPKDFMSGQNLHNSTGSSLVNLPKTKSYSKYPGREESSITGLLYSSKWNCPVF
jgi:hypothetical protein